MKINPRTRSLIVKAAAVLAVMFVLIAATQEANANPPTPNGTPNGGVIRVPMSAAQLMPHVALPNVSQIRHPAMPDASQIKHPAMPAASQVKHLAMPAASQINHAAMPSIAP
jgi:hypothetical protein